MKLLKARENSKSNKNNKNSHVPKYQRVNIRSAHSDMLSDITSSESEYDNVFSDNDDIAQCKLYIVVTCQMSSPQFIGLQMVGNGPRLPEMVIGSGQGGWGWSEVAGNGRKWSEMVRNGRKWSETVKMVSEVMGNGQKWSGGAGDVGSGRKWSEMVRNGQKWFEMVGNGHKWSYIFGNG